MSGPKSSRYTLTAEQLRQLREEQERLQKQLEEKARKERECKEALSYLASVKSKATMHTERLQVAENRLSGNETDLTALREHYRSVYSLIDQINLTCSAKPDASHSALMSSKQTAEKLLNMLVPAEEGLAAETDKAVLTQRIRGDSAISDGMKISFENVGLVESTEDPVFSQTIDMLEQLLNTEISQQLANEVRNAIKQAKEIESVSAMQNFSSITAEPICRKCRNYLVFASQNKTLYESLLDRYAALCSQVGIQPAQFELSEAGIAELKSNIADLERQLSEDAQRAYISRSVDEVMAEMGYEVIGRRHVRKKSGKEFSSRLLTYEDGTVINVTESSGGQITMEVGGADSRDRLPDANERVALRKTMESFCKDFSEIEQRLAARGVVLNNRLSMMPPDEAYAQIINLSDYELDKEYNVASSKRTTTQAANRKLMRDE